jgi:uncharacterized YccA/Bax inhibitor family protein
MAFGKSSNPALNKKIFDNALERSTDEVMTINGTVHKTFLLLLLVIVSASLTWKMVLTGAAVGTWIAIGGIGGFITAIVTIFNKKLSPYLSPLYALLEGLFLGGISAFFAEAFTGLIIIQAVVLTFGILFTLLFAYRTGLIKATSGFKRGVIAATGGVALLYVATWILQIFGINVAFMHDGGLLSIVISLVIIVIAALNLILDFNFIEEGAKAGAPKYFEWYAAFGLIVTIIWLYLEILRLLSYFTGRN